MKLNEIEDKYLFKFCNPGNGPVLCCGLEIEETIFGHRVPFTINFISCSDDLEGFDFVDNVFISDDGINWKQNWSGESGVVFTPRNDEFIFNFIRRLFNGENDSFIQRILECQNI